MDGADGDKIRIKNQKLGVGDCKSMIVGGVDVSSCYRTIRINSGVVMITVYHSVVTRSSEASLRRKRMRVREKTFV